SVGSSGGASGVVDELAMIVIGRGAERRCSTPHYTVRGASKHRPVGPSPRQVRFGGKQPAAIVAKFDGCAADTDWEEPVPRGC
ncbi:MAG: hypothetical protein AAGG46_10105, partial [Planctomycetota bacterium]